MRNFYLRKKESLNKLRDDTEKSGSSNNLQKINVNKYLSSGNLKKNYKNHLKTDININPKKQKKDRISSNSNELSKILSKINQEFNKNNKNYANISDCFQKDYLYLKNMNTTKTNVSSSQNLSRNYSQCSFNNLRDSCIYDKKKQLNIFTPNYISNRNIFYTNQFTTGNNSTLTDYGMPPMYQIQPITKQHSTKNTISNFILKRQNNNPYAYTEIEVENDKKKDNDNDIKIIQVRKLHKSQKRNKSQNKFKTNIIPIYTNLKGINTKNKALISNPRVIHNLGNFYHFWSDNDGHLGGKINLALNNIYRNKINFHFYLYYIIKIQSHWRGYFIRKYLLKKSGKNSKLNIFYKQKTLLKLLFFILIKKYKKICFQIFMEKINNRINSKGYDINSSLLNNISDCYQKYNKQKKGQNLLLYNKKRLNEEKNNLKLYNKDRYSDINTPKMKKYNTNNRFNYSSNNNNKDNTDNKNKINYSNYKIFKTTQLCYRHKKKKTETDIDKEDKKEKEKMKLFNNKKANKFMVILPSKPNNFSIENKKNKNINDKNDGVTIKRKKTSLKNIEKTDNIINNNKNRINKYKEYIYFFFLLFARIQKANHRNIFKILINRLNEIKNDNLKKIKKDKLLKIIKINERKKIMHYFKIFKEKVLTEKIKDKILNNNNNLQTAKNNNKYLSRSEIKMYNNNNNLSNSISHNLSNNISLNRISRQHSGKKYIKIKKIKRSTSYNNSLKKNMSAFLNNHSYLGFSRSPLFTPKNLIVKKRTNNIILQKYGEYYKFSPEYLLCKKVKNIFDKLDKKEIKSYFKRWKVKKDARKKKKFLIYFIMLMKEYFCNDKSLKYNKEYTLGKFMFFWYRKTFY